MDALTVAILCGVVSIVYAIWATRSVLAADAGNARMQEIAGAIREGASAYLNRQYITIAFVGVRPVAELYAGQMIAKVVLSAVMVPLVIRLVLWIGARIDGHEISAAKSGDDS